MSIHMHDLNIANNLDVLHNITAEHISSSKTITAPSISTEQLLVLNKNNNEAILTVDKDNGVIVNGMIQTSQLAASQSITGTSMYLNQNIYFFHKPEGSTTWTSNFRLGQYESNGAILETLTEEGTLVLQSDNINITGKLLINGATPLHANNFNDYAPSLTGDGASGEWGISAYPRLSQLTSLPTSDYSILLTSKKTESSAYYTDDLALKQIYDGQEYWHALQLPDVCLGSNGPSNCLSRKTINIAGTDVNIWGGTLSIETLVTSLEGHGINANSASYATSANYANEAGRAEALLQSHGTAGNSSSPVYFDDGLPLECKMTNITLYSSNNHKSILSLPNQSNNFDTWYDLPPFSSGNDICTLLSNIFIQGVQGDTYGFTQSDLPSNPENGQIFFNIDDSNENIITTDNGKWIPAIPYIYISNN